MNKWWWFGGGLVVIALMLSGIHFFSQPTVLNNWSTDEKVVVLNNKTWKIAFSEKIDPDSITQDTVYVTDSDGNHVAVRLSLSNDQRTLHVEPPETGYKMDTEYYTLHVSERIVSMSGRHIRSNTSFSFIVKETLPTIDSKERLDDYFASIIKDEKKRRNEYLMNDASGAEAGAAKADLASADSAKSSGESASDFSKTNIQVDGVDEADLVKTDGTFLYEVMDDRLIITKLVPAEQMEVMSMITYQQPDFSPIELFLYKDRLVVIGHSYDEPKEKASKQMVDRLFPAAFHSTKAVVYDISDRSDPTVVRQVEMEGNYISSRRIDETVYFIAQQYPNYWMLEKNSKADFRPRVLDTAASKEKKPVDYDEIRYFPQSKESDFTIIGSFNIDNSEQQATFTTYLGGGQNVYMSESNLYLAVTNFPRITAESIDDWTADSTIYKFSLDGENVTFDASTEIRGRILNQFSMDEHKGNFRVVTTSGTTWNEDHPSRNNLYIFDEHLKRIGKLEDLARGEKIYSARFMQDRVYMVTFKQVDPLFVIDARDPRNPEVLGKLKIPGFSNYLHPFDDTHLIGFGYDTKTVSNPELKGQTRTLTQGVKVSLFDVSDVNHPIEIDNEIIGGRGTQSPLNWDHRALFVNKERNLYGFPITVYEDVETNEYEQKFVFQGAMLYNIDLKNGIRLKEKITHMEGSRPFDEWEKSIRRMVYINDHLYAISPDMITAHDLDTFKKVGDAKIKRKSVLSSSQNKTYGVK